MGWLRRGGRAARTAADRGDLWLPGALGALAFFAWLPFVAVVVPVPSVADLAFWGAGFLGPAGMLRAALISIGVFGFGVAMAALAALAQAVLLDWLAPSSRRPRPLLGRVGAALFSIHLVCSVPAALALLVGGVAFASIGPAEFQAPDIRGPLVVRILVAMAPYLGLLAAAVLLGQLIGGAATRHVAYSGLGVGEALASGVRDLVRRPAQLLAVAVLTLLVHVAYLVAGFALLRILWAPIAPAFAIGQLVDARTPLLLVGFIAIWFCLVLGAGAVHAWASAWWSVELADANRARAAGTREESEPSARQT